MYRILYYIKRDLSRDDPQFDSDEFSAYDVCPLIVRKYQKYVGKLYIILIYVFHGAIINIG